ncbi:MAG: hypothetical protein ACW980_25705 [Promethearchaeota archaeon]|jgi:hypothetical protein
MKFKKQLPAPTNNPKCLSLYNLHRYKKLSHKKTKLTENEWYERCSIGSNLPINLSIRLISGTNSVIKTYFLIKVSQFVIVTQRLEN